MNSTPKKMTGLKIVAAFFLIVALLATTIHARPSNHVSRQKRVSDQRLAELETLVALGKLRGQLVTVPVAFGRFDPDKVGRRRRSSVENGLQRLQRLLQTADEESRSVGQESEEFASLIWEDVKDRKEEETEDQFS